MPPTLNHFWRVRRGGGMFLSSKYRSWRHECETLIFQKTKFVMGLFNPGPVANWEIKAHYVFHFVKTPKVQDLDNRLKPLIDLLAKAYGTKDHLLDRIEASRELRKQEGKKRARDFVMVSVKLLKVSTQAAGAGALQKSSAGRRPRRSVALLPKS